MNKKIKYAIVKVIAIDRRTCPLCNEIIFSFLAIAAFNNNNIRKRINENEINFILSIYMEIAIKTKGIKNNKILNRMKGP